MDERACRRCGRVFSTDGDIVGRLTRVCPRCRGGGTPSGGVPASDPVWPRELAGMEGER